MASVSKYGRTTQDEALRRLEAGEGLKAVALALKAPYSTVEAWRRTAFKPGPLEVGETVAGEILETAHVQLQARVRWACCGTEAWVNYSALRKMQASGRCLCETCAASGRAKKKVFQPLFVEELPLERRPNDHRARHEALCAVVLRKVFPWADLCG